MPKSSPPSAGRRYRRLPQLTNGPSSDPAFPVPNMRHEFRHVSFRARAAPVQPVLEYRVRLKRVAHCVTPTHSQVVEFTGTCHMPSCWPPAAGVSDCPSRCRGCLPHCRSHEPHCTSRKSVISAFQPSSAALRSSSAASQRPSDSLQRSSARMQRSSATLQQLSAALRGSSDTLQQRSDSLQATSTALPRRVPRSNAGGRRAAAEKCQEFSGVLSGLLRTFVRASNPGGSHDQERTTTDGDARTGPRLRRHARTLVSRVHACRQDSRDARHGDGPPTVRQGREHHTCGPTNECAKRDGAGLTDLRTRVIVRTGSWLLGAGGRCARDEDEDGDKNLGRRTPSDYLYRMCADGDSGEDLRAR